MRRVTKTRTNVHAGRIIHTNSKIHIIYALCGAVELTDPLGSRVSCELCFKLEQANAQSKINEPECLED